MSDHLTPEQQELIVGYVLGDLDSEKLKQFRELLKQNPVLEAEVLSLQEALGAMPYGLDAQEPPVELRSRLLAAATPLSTGAGQQRQFPWGRMVGGLAVGVALLLGVQNWQLRQQLASQQANEEAVTAEEYLPRDQEWQAFSEVLADHKNSLTRSQGPVDLATADVAVVRSAYAEKMKLPEMLPQLKKAQLLGGSFCELTQTKGIRLSYKVQNGQTVSLYQLLRSEGFPRISEGELGPPIDITEGPNAFVWGDQDYVYILVGDLPVPQMKQLAPTIQSI